MNPCLAFQIYKGRCVVYRERVFLDGRVPGAGNTKTLPVEAAFAKQSNHWDCSKTATDERNCNYYSHVFFRNSEQTVEPYPPPGTTPPPTGGPGSTTTTTTATPDVLVPPPGGQPNATNETLPEFSIPGTPVPCVQPGIQKPLPPGGELPPGEEQDDFVDNFAAERALFTMRTRQIPTQAGKRHHLMTEGGSAQWGSSEALGQVQRLNTVCPMVRLFDAGEAVQLFDDGSAQVGSATTPNFCSSECLPDQSGNVVLKVGCDLSQSGVCKSARRGLEEADAEYETCVRRRVMSGEERNGEGSNVVGQHVDDCESRRELMVRRLSYANRLIVGFDSVGDGRSRVDFDVMKVELLAGVASSSSTGSSSSSSSQGGAAPVAAPSDTSTETTTASAANSTIGGSESPSTSASPSQNATQNSDDSTSQESTAMQSTSPSGSLPVDGGITTPATPVPSSTFYATSMASAVTVTVPASILASVQKQAALKRVLQTAVHNAACAPFVGPAACFVSVSDCKRSTNIHTSKSSCNIASASLAVVWDPLFAATSGVEIESYRRRGLQQGGANTENNFEFTVHSQTATAAENLRQEMVAASSGAAGGVFSASAIEAAVRAELSADPQGVLASAAVPAVVVAAMEVVAEQVVVESTEVAGVVNGGVFQQRGTTARPAGNGGSEDLSGTRNVDQSSAASGRIYPIMSILRCVGLAMYCYSEVYRSEFFAAI